LPPVWRSSVRCCGGRGPVPSSAASARSTCRRSPSAWPLRFRPPLRARGAGILSRGGSASGSTWGPRWHPAIAPSSSTRPCRAESSVMCTAACATGGTQATPDADCGPLRGNGSRARSCRPPSRLWCCCSSRRLCARTCRRYSECWQPGSWLLPWWAGTFLRPARPHRYRGCCERCETTCGAVS